MKCIQNCKKKVFGVHSGAGTDTGENRDVTDKPHKNSHNSVKNQYFSMIFQQSDDGIPFFILEVNFFTGAANGSPVKKISFLKIPGLTF